MSTKIKIWYKLVDSNGQPFKGNDVASVKVEIGTTLDVDDFREKLVELMKESILKGIAPAQLTVYKNQQEYNNRNHQVESLKTAPLKLSFKVDGLILNEDAPLVVEVPECKIYVLMHCRALIVLSIIHTFSGKYLYSL
jgi:predicted TIM-barrel fold metal-dependent hydrolase